MFFMISADNPGKSRSECLDILMRRLTKIQEGLKDEYHGDSTIRDSSFVHAAESKNVK